MHPASYYSEIISPAVLDGDIGAPERKFLYLYTNQKPSYTKSNIYCKSCIPMIYLRQLLLFTCYVLGREMNLEQNDIQNFNGQKIKIRQPNAMELETERTRHKMPGV